MVFEDVKEFLADNLCTCCDVLTLSKCSRCDSFYCSSKCMVEDKHEHASSFGMENLKITVTGFGDVKERLVKRVIAQGQKTAAMDKENSNRNLGQVKRNPVVKVKENLAYSVMKDKLPESVKNGSHVSVQSRLSKVLERKPTLVNEKDQSDAGIGHCNNLQAPAASRDDRKNTQSASATGTRPKERQNAGTSTINSGVTTKIMHANRDHAPSRGAIQKMQGATSLTAKDAMQAGPAQVNKGKKHGRRPYFGTTLEESKKSVAYQVMEARLPPDVKNGVHHSAQECLIRALILADRIEELRQYDKQYGAGCDPDSDEDYEEYAEFLKEPTWEYAEVVTFADLKFDIKTENDAKKFISKVQKVHLEKLPMEQLEELEKKIAELKEKYKSGAFKQ